MLLRKGKVHHEPESHCHFIYFYFVLAISVLVIVCGMSTMSDILGRQSTMKVPAATLRTSVKLSGPQVRASGNHSVDVPFALVSRHDPGLAASVHDRFTSVLTFGSFTKPVSSGAFTLNWESSRSLSTSINIRGFGMVVGELVAFCGKLFAADQATGIVYEVGANGDSYPRHIVMGGDGMRTEGLQSEWATIKGGILYIGTSGLRREVPWVSSPVGRALVDIAKDRKYNKGSGSQRRKITESLSARRGALARMTPVDWNTPNWIVTIDPSGRVNHLDWSKEFAALEDAAGVLSTNPSVTRSLCHEAVLWSDTMNSWLFLPTVVEVPSPAGLNNGVVTRGSTNRARPRRLSHHNPEEELSSVRTPRAEAHEGGDVLLMQTPPDFQAIEVTPINVNDIIMSTNVSFPSRFNKDTAVFQFTSAKFLPNSGDKIIVAVLTVQSVTVNKRWSFLTFLSTDGSQLHPSVFIPDSEAYIYSGLEFL